VLKRVLTRVDFPRPDSPENCASALVFSPVHIATLLTNDHNVEVEALAHTLAMPLVGQVGETDVASKLPANNVPHVARRLGCGLGVLGGDGLRCMGAAVKHGVAVLDVAGRCGLAV
jgi:hypothetical protein